MSNAATKIEEIIEREYEHGFYTVRQPGSDPERPFVIAVNVDLEESNMTRIDPDELVLQIEATTARYLR